MSVEAMRLPINTVPHMSLTPDHRAAPTSRSNRPRSEAQLRALVIFALRRRGVSPEDAEDCVNAAWLRMLEFEVQERRVVSEHAWLLKASWRLYLSECRLARRRAELPDGEGSPPLTHSGFDPRDVETPEQALLRQGAQIEVGGLLDALKDAARRGDAIRPDQVELLLQYMDQHLEERVPVATLAQLHNLHPNVYANRVHRAKCAARRALSALV